MSARLQTLAALAWRDSRTARRRLLLFMSSISIGVAALVATDSYSANVVRSIREQSRTLLGADLALSSRERFPASVDSLLDSLQRQGVRVGRLTTFASMVVAPRTGSTRLVQVRAASPEVPLYGRIDTYPEGAWTALRAGQHALVDSSLLVDLGAHVGDSLTLGYARFAIIGTLRNVPGDIGIASALGPRVYIPDRFVGETRLLAFGSRAEYEALLRLPEGVSPSSIATAHQATLEAAHVRARTAKDTERSLTRGVDQLDRFLGVVGLVALLLGGIGVASAIHAYVQEKVDAIAVLRCVGATSGQVLGIYLLEAIALGLVGAAIGTGLGMAVQFALPHVLGGFIPVDVQPRLEPTAIAAGLAMGTWVAAIFALIPLLAVRRISPLQALRRQVEGAPPPQRIVHDVPRIIAALALAASVVVIAISRAGSTARGLWMSGGIGVAILALWLSALAIALLARRLLREHWPFVMRQGVANLYRPANQTRAIMIALGFAAFLISTLYLVQRNVLRQLELSSGATQANLAFFDVQEDQAQGVSALIRAADHPVLQEVPIVPMRIAAIDGRRGTELTRGRASWAVRREYRSSYRDTLIASERITAGRWFGAHRSGGVAEISVEQGVASDLGVTLGDTITWDVQGVRIPTVVTSLREVNWARFEPNFFVIFSPAALEGAPQTYVILTRADDAAARAALQRDVVRRYPNVSAIDISAIESAISGILARISIAIRFMALFSIGTGALVLLSAVAASRRQRLREGVLLKTLGATRAQIGRIMLSEYTVLGILGSLTGIILSIAGGWALTRFLFKAPFSLPVPPLVVLVGGMVVLTISVGLWSSRDVFRETAMAALRGE
jgi:putative ABC transport system permease protein